VTDTTEALRQSITEAVARGWCHPGCTDIEMDSTLALAIVDEVLACISTPAAADGEPVALLRKLTLMARTSGGTAGPDAGLMAACEEAEAFLAAAPSAVAPQEQARFLFVAMDDNGFGHPEFCRDEAAVRDAVGRSMFFSYNPATMDADHLAQVQGTTDELIEDGFIRFEGDPGFTLYRLAPAAPSAVASPSECDSLTGREGEGA
jgi:hypothetical protein